MLGSEACFRPIVLDLNFLASSDVEDDGNVADDVEDITDEDVDENDPLLSSLSYLVLSLILGLEVVKVHSNNSHSPTESCKKISKLSFTSFFLTTQPSKKKGL